jgi:hypothetical protein
MDVVQLLGELGQKVEYVNKRQAVADEAKASYDKAVAKAKAAYDAVVESGSATLEAANQDLAKAKDELQSLREQLYQALGPMSEPKNPRVTISQ